MPRAWLLDAQENLWHWMMDPRGRDQFVIRYQDATEICWNDAQRTQAEEVYKRSFWTESFVGWSPHGSYLATMHRQGIALWGGPSFSRLVRFTHQNVGPSPVAIMSSAHTVAEQCAVTAWVACFSSIPGCASKQGQKGKTLQSRAHASGKWRSGIALLTLLLSCMPTQDS